MPRLLKSLTIGGRTVSGFTPRAEWGSSSSLGMNERSAEEFASYVEGIYKKDGVVFACMLARQMLFSEARFAWRKFRNGQPRSLFTTSELALLERPWPTGVTGDLLTRMIQDADLGGAAYHTTIDASGRIGGRGPGARVKRMRPDWVQIIIGSDSGNPYDLDAQPAGFLYSPPQADPVLLTTSQVSMFAPIPDPIAQYRGMSWLTPVIREIRADQAATDHKLRFFKNGATISTVVSLDQKVGPAAFEQFVSRMRAATEGVDNAYKTLYVGGGADVTLNGSTMQQLDFKVTQGAGETRIASASGMHPVLVGLSEGLQGSALNAGNFDAAVRLSVDKTIRNLWRTASASLENLLTRPGDDSQLWYDDRDIAILRDDSTDQAAIQQQQAATLKSLIDGGWTPESAVEFIDTGSVSVLEHTGLATVQLQQQARALPAPSNTPTPEEA